MYVYSLERMLGSWRECILLERMHSFLSQSDLCNYVYLKECRALWRECRALGENTFSWRECTASSFRVICVIMSTSKNVGLFGENVGLLERMHSLGENAQLPHSEWVVYCLFSCKRALYSLEGALHLCTVYFFRKRALHSLKRALHLCTVYFSAAFREETGTFSPREGILSKSPTFSPKSPTFLEVDIITLFFRGVSRGNWRYCRSTVVLCLECRALGENAFSWRECASFLGTVFLCLYTCIHVYMYVYVYMYIHVCICIYVHTYTCMYMYMGTYMYV